MASKVRACSFFWNGRRFKAQFTGSVGVTEQSEPIYDEDGYVDMSDGAQECDVECTYIAQVTGTPIVFHVGDRGNLTLSPVNGQVFTVTNAKVIEAPFDWDSQKGTCTGKLKIHGGRPSYQG